jgi:hypothetical protein
MLLRCTSPIEAFVVEIFPDLCLVIHGLHAHTRGSAMKTASLTHLCGTSQNILGHASHGWRVGKECLCWGKKAHHHRADRGPAHSSQHFFVRRGSNRRGGGSFCLLSF